MLKTEGMKPFGRCVLRCVVNIKTGLTYTVLILVAQDTLV